MNGQAKILICHLNILDRLHIEPYGHAQAAMGTIFIGYVTAS